MQSDLSGRIIFIIHHHIYDTCFFVVNFGVKDWAENREFSLLTIVFMCVVESWLGLCTSEKLNGGSNEHTL